MALQQIPAGSAGFRFAHKKEATYKVAPSGTYFELPITGEAVVFRRESSESPTITSTGESEGSVTTRESSEGAINAVFRPKVFDPLIEGAIWSQGWLCGASGFVAATPTNAVISVATVNFGFASAGNGLPLLVAGDVFAVSDAENWGHVGLYRVRSSPTPTTAAFEAVKLDGTAPFANAGPEALRIAKVGATASLTITAVGAGATATIDILDATGAATALAQGWIKLGGMVNQTNNGIWRVTSAASTTLTLARDNSSGSFSTETGANAFWSLGEFAQNGNQRTSFTEEKYWDLATDIRQLFTGRVYGQMALNVSVGDRVTAAFTGQGALMTLPGSDQGSLYVTPPQTLEGSQLDVSGLVIGTTLIPHRSSSFDFNKNVRPIDEVGVKGASQIVAGTQAVTGTIQAYTEDMAQVQRFLDESFHPVQMVINQPDKNGYVVKLPRCKLTQADVNTSGQNSDSFTQLAFTSQRDVSLGYQARIYRFHA